MHEGQARRLRSLSRVGTCRMRRDGAARRPRGQPGRGDRTPPQGSRRERSFGGGRRWRDPDGPGRSGAVGRRRPRRWGHSESGRSPDKECHDGRGPEQARQRAGEQPDRRGSFPGRAEVRVDPGAGRVGTVRRPARRGRGDVSEWAAGSAHGDASRQPLRTRTRERGRAPPARSLDPAIGGATAAPARGGLDAL